MSEGLSIFVDEYGDTSLRVERSGTSGFFIITAILVEDRGVASLRSQVDAIRHDHFGPGEMKSSSIGGDDERRLRILGKTAALPYKSYTLAVDKSELDREGGLAYKRSFFKYLNKRLYERLYKLFDNVLVIADEHGTEEFMKGFKAYVDRELKPDLFSRREFRFQRSHDEPLLQLADLLSGSIARSVDPKKLSARADEIRALISPRSVGIEFWPPLWTLQFSATIDEPETDRHDKMVERYCSRQVTLFLQQHADKAAPTESIRAQLEILRYLAFQVQFADRTGFASAGAIVDWLATSSNIEVTARGVGSLIASLRDAGVLISSSNKGYKIPVSVSDMLEYVDHANSIVPSMLTRLGAARNDLRAATLGELDILQSSDYSLLNALIAALSARERPTGQ